MGTIRNEMTIVHHYDKNELEKVREDAIKFFNEVADKDLDGLLSVADLIDSMISPIMRSYINQEYTFVINGDCSKIGWETSERFHEARMKWCEKHKHDVQNIIVINFGEGDEPCRIVFDSTGLKTESENMADIELVINIPERIHYGIEKGITVNGSKASQILIDAVKNGIPLEQEPVLDKIRAEISAIKSHHINDGYDDGFQGCRTNVLHILDKYKGESEK